MVKLALFSPDLLDTSAVAARLFSVALCAVESLRGETFVHFDFDIVAASNSFVYESLGMTLIESSHDLFAIDVVRGVEVRMHDCGGIRLKIRTT